MYIWFRFFFCFFLESCNLEWGGVVGDRGGPKCNVVLCFQILLNKFFYS